MKKVLALLFLIGTLARAQTTRSVVDLPGSFTSQFYRGNAITIKLKYPAQATSVRSVYYKGKGQAPFEQQATVTDSTAEGLTLSWANSTSFPDAGWLEILFNGKVVAAGTIGVSYQTVNAPKLDTFTFSGPAAAPMLNITNSSGLITKFFPVTGAVSGHVLTHSFTSRLVTGYFIRSDNNQVDPLWYPVYTSDNAALLKGPPNETATGTVVVNIYFN